MGEGDIMASSSFEWLTPQSEIDGFILPTLDYVDLDPAWSEHSMVPATVRLMHDSFDREWLAQRVYCNPPYGERWISSWGARPDWFHPLSEWVARLMAVAGAGGPRSVLALLPARMDVRWLHDCVAPHAHQFYPRGRIAFARPGATGAPSSPGHASLYALWSNEPDVIERFADLARGRGMYVPPDRPSSTTPSRRAERPNRKDENK